MGPHFGGSPFSHDTGFVPPRRRRRRLYWVRKVRAKGAILVPVRAILVRAWRFLNKAFRKTAGAVVTISIIVQPTLPVSSLITCTLAKFNLFMDCVLLSLCMVSSHGQVSLHMPRSTSETMHLYLQCNPVRTGAIPCTLEYLEHGRRTR